MPPLLFALPGNEALTDALAGMLGAETGAFELRKFPDAETYLRIESDVAGKDVALVCTLDRPDEKVVPLCFMSRLAKDLGARSVGLVAPYLAYMRQDRRFHPGEAVSSEYFGSLLGGMVDWLVTVDPHLHRRANLGEVFDIPTVNVHAAPTIASWIREHVPDPLVVGPDSESRQWVSEVAEAAGAPYVVSQKVREGDRLVSVQVPNIEEVKTRTPVLVDDIISTGHTMMETVRHLLETGMKPPVCIGIHAVFAGNAYTELLAAGAASVVTCNTIPHETNAIDVAPLLATAIQEIHGD